MKNKKIANIFLRIGFAVIVPAIIAAGLIYLYNYGNPFICIFNKFLHLYCPGCGSGRAAYDIVHLNILGAIHHNLLVTLFLPIIVYIFIKYYINFVFKNRLPSINLSNFACYLLILSIFLFTVLRNIQLFPFTLLAP